jgi:hypothetical protein
MRLSDIEAWVRAAHNHGIASFHDGEAFADFVISCTAEALGDAAALEMTKEMLSAAIAYLRKNIGDRATAEFLADALKGRRYLCTGQWKGIRRPEAGPKERAFLAACGAR